MKSENWIKWDLDSRAGVKMSAFVSEYGAEGYGVFIWLVEILYRAEGNRYLLDTNGYKCITKSFKLIQTKLEAMIAALCEYGLLQKDGNYIYSARVQAEVQKREALSEKRQLAVKTRWEAKHRIQPDTSVLQTDTSTIQTDTNRYREEKKRREKSRKEETPLTPHGGTLVMPIELDTPEARQALDQWLEYKRQRRQAYKSAGSLSVLLAQWAPRGSATFCAAVRHSIGNNYSGLYESKENKPAFNATDRKREFARQEYLALLQEEEEKKNGSGGNV